MIGLAAFFYLLGLVLAHQGMKIGPDMKDIGVLFSEEDFQGNSTFLVETNLTNECFRLLLNTDSEPEAIQVNSIQICQPVDCMLFTGPNCSKSDDMKSFSVKVAGEGDATKLDLPDFIGYNFRSYMCGDRTIELGSDWQILLDEHAQ
ncbi:hypothetical protein EJ04DRAFT_58102 [Polyplosphaeria fusca]|uniref:Uncharacterized protein n=1 Tax=Polyplosphaeria fusca TaxID=682080 RepID=A0A9P4QR37_9PLEO|nr:hypothetical protein EJ04DRAFT_58102 [Polyplosphaeria fusca]